MLYIVYVKWRRTPYEISRILSFSFRDRLDIKVINGVLFRYIAGIFEDLSGTTEQRSLYGKVSDM